MKIAKKPFATLGAALLAAGCATLLACQRGPAPAPQAGLARQEEAKKPVYQCPMHPQIIRDQPGRCPICGMDLQLVEDSATDIPPAGAAGAPAAALAPAAIPPGAAGRASFALSVERQQLIGVTKAKAEKRMLSWDVRASGRVAFDPELFAALEEHRQALEAETRMRGGALADQSAGLVESSRTKLRLLGLSEAQIQALRSGKSPEMSLILPKGKAWVYAEIYEHELQSLRAGTAVEVESPFLAGEVFQGRVASVSPVLNAQTRTLRVRAEVPDPRGLLRPDSFVNVRIRLRIGEKLSVPADAVLNTGNADIVFAIRDGGIFEPRSVVVGHRGEEWVEIREGIAEGETVATAANFLLDSESRMKAAARAGAPVTPIASSTPGGIPR